MLSPFSIVITLTADSSRAHRTAKLDYGTMTDEMRMELLIANVEIADPRALNERKAKMIFLKEKTWTRKKICDWQSVRCDADGSVIALHWQRHYLSIAFRTPGTLDVSWLPPLCATAIFENQRAFGTIEAASLPHRIEYLNLRNNQLTGTIDIAALPESIVVLNLSKNKLCGPIGLSTLPQCIEIIDLSNNGIHQERVLIKNTTEDKKLQRIDLRENSILSIQIGDGKPCEDLRVRL